MCPLEKNKLYKLRYSTQLTVAKVYAKCYNIACNMFALKKVYGS